MLRALRSDCLEEASKIDKDLELYGTPATEHRWAHASTARLAETFENQISEMLARMPQAR